MGYCVMKKSAKIVIGLILLVLIFVVLHSLLVKDTPDQWSHKTFQGTVSEIWEEDNHQYFRLTTRVNENEYCFIIDDEVLASIDLHVGDEVVVESDYNINEHNGKDTPYPATLVADASIHD